MSYAFVVDGRETARARLLRMGVALVVLGACSCALMASTANAAKSPKPVISSFAATAKVGSGGTVTVKAIVSGATTCTLSSTKSVAGLPATFPCEASSVNRSLAMPSNAGSKAATYKLKLKASGASGSAKAKTTVIVRSSITSPGISAGDKHACAVVSSGGVLCWGANEHGQLGNGAEASTGTPTEVAHISAVQVSAGGSHTCALLLSGQVDCWGQNYWGQLGNGTTTDSSKPVAVTGIGGTVTQVTAGADHTCVLLSSGHIECWGKDVYGQLGNGTKSRAPVTTPQPVSGITNAVEVVSDSGDDTCALLSEGHVACWGWNNAGQLGNGNEKDSALPVEVPGITGATDVTTGTSHTCAALSSGHVECWGYNRKGQLGDGTTTDSLTPVEVLGVSEATKVVAGRATCALVSGGRVQCWGDDEYGELGQGGPVSGSASYSTSAVEVTGVSGVSALSDNEDHVCALLETEAVSCWGFNEHGELGHGTTGLGLAPVEVLGLSGATQVSAGFTSCAVLSGGNVDCWGYGEGGQLGNGATLSSELPVEVAGLSDATQVAASGSHVCAVRETGGVVCWGRGDKGELGNGGTTGSETPIEVPGVTEATQVALGASYSCAVLSSGKVDCWGENEIGQLGDGTTEDKHEPVEVQGITNATRVTAGRDTTCALLSSGHEMCWGWDVGGMLGAGVSERSPTPLEVQGITNGTSLAAGSFHACTSLADGHADCWGADELGQLGHGAFEENSNVPVGVLTITNAAQIAAGDQHSCALLSTGHIKCWGRNYAGNLGTGGSPEESDLALETVGITTATQVSAGGENSCALVSGGHVDCWGNDWEGQLGNGTAWSYTPVSVVGVP